MLLQDLRRSLLLEEVVPLLALERFLRIHLHAGMLWWAALVVRVVDVKLLPRESFSSLLGICLEAVSCELEEALVRRLSLFGDGCGVLYLFRFLWRLCLEG